MTLHGLADSAVYFADRPRREIGHSPSRRFVELWAADAQGTGPCSFFIDVFRQPLSPVSVAESKRRSQRQKRSAT
jgi:hypothetical protein